MLQNVTEAWATESPGLCGWEVTERTDEVAVEALAETFTEDGSGLGMHLEERRQRRQRPVALACGELLPQPLCGRGKGREKSV